MISASFWMVVMLVLTSWLWTRLISPCHDWVFFTVSLILTVLQALVVIGYVAGYRELKKRNKLL